MLHVGPHAFTDEDAERTLAQVGVLFDLLERDHAADAIALVAPHRRRAQAATDALLEEVLASGTAEGTEAALGEVWHAWRDAAAALRSSGALGGPLGGRVDALFVSGGGVPKSPVATAEVTWSGLAGDAQHDRRNHGRPWQALSLWSGEVIDALAAAGHPVAPGTAGENITVRGLPWDAVRPGVLVAVGDVIAEVWAYALPCKTIAGSFTDGHFDVIHHRHGPVSRVYAAVVEPGTIVVGDRVSLLG